MYVELGENEIRINGMGADMVKSRKKTIALQLAIGAVGAALLLMGLRQGEYAVTMNKAVRICLECIGIG